MPKRKKRKKATMQESNRTACWTKKRLIAETAKDLQKAIRLENTDEHGWLECVTCGKRLRWDANNTAGQEGMDAGHFITGRANSILFEEDNIHPQCNHCNRTLSGNQEKYTAYMVERYGQDRVEELRRQRGEVVKFARGELLEMRAGYRARWKARLTELKGVEV